MRKRNLPQPFQIDKVRFADCFTAPSLQHFGVLITGWVLTVGVHTISQLILADRSARIGELRQHLPFPAEGQMDSGPSGFQGFSDHCGYPVAGRDGD